MVFIWKCPKCKGKNELQAVFGSSNIRICRTCGLRVEASIVIVKNKKGKQNGEYKKTIF
jgi:hypothetical protein